MALVDELKQDILKVLEDNPDKVNPSMFFGQGLGGNGGWPGCVYNKTNPEEYEVHHCVIGMYSELKGCNPEKVGNNTSAINTLVHDQLDGLKNYAIIPEDVAADLECRRVLDYVQARADSRYLGAYLSTWGQIAEELRVEWKL